ncbi:hypothetical protein CAPTEDRAFT_152525 [Capitella teleta]|uniref:Neurotransmitter-gated ion-channel ligand-binding domain-containing protein n=1 Tax=Capitella teleta TaxID=283909 RepID=R7UM62_CAPTE|nr:hypothetical protein CAPTEDRAFT_152525 [Capitella teleta]|eukprot:ELU04362.1 hypothetical protein CAPTEDRAFT_152525 [Capitella teleta]
MLWFCVCGYALLVLLPGTPANEDAKRLYENKLRKSGYNRNIRPVTNDTETVDVSIGLKMAQILDVDERNQIMTTNVWVKLEWLDNRLTWDPEEYGDVDMLYVPAEDLWHPDIVLYNTGDGRYEMTEGTKATVYYNGLIKWTPPASFKSSCDIDALHFPFDQQTCGLQFGSWTYNIEEVNIRHVWQNQEDEDYDENRVLDTGIDMSAFYKSVEWDVMAVPAFKGLFHYAGSQQQFEQWTFELTLRRKFLFYTVNLIIPLISHSFITVLVFYLPSDSKEKIALSINILLSLTVFFLMFAEIIPPTSIVVPLLGKYLIFTLVLVVTSVMITCITYNVHFRSPATHKMPDWVRKVFLYWLPRILMMRRPKIENSHDVHLKHIQLNLCTCLGDQTGQHFQLEDGEPRYQFGSKRTRTQTELIKLSHEIDSVSGHNEYGAFSPEVRNAIEGAIFIANHMKQEDVSNRVSHPIKEDWKYIALVIDRLFLWIYSCVGVFGTLGIICSAQAIFDPKAPLEFNSTSGG